MAASFALIAIVYVLTQVVCRIARMPGFVEHNLLGSSAGRRLQ
jgi:hypothetical protein